ncbi:MULTISPECIES: TetR/AcrR family transcriptional regulator [Micrococcaceae]|uniref:TetR/AcrR family transcriptional regulator n=1 Tax=unclassified Kocuria TaxID=2649579 RepID=UPI001EE001F1|nr:MULTISPECIES: TetR/AcrR family transcriptional regulator [unclassified Kocuria]
MTNVESQNLGENPGPIRRRPGRTNRTQLKLFEAAMVIMSEKGPTATTVEEVAAKAGVSKGTVYYNFGSKKSMVDGLLRYGVKLVLETIEDAGEGIADPRDRIARGVIASLRFLEGQPGFARLAVAEMWRPHGGTSEVLAEQRSVIIDRVTDLVDDLDESYETAEHPDSRSIAVALFGSTFMLAMDREMNLSVRTTQDAARAALKIVDGYIVGRRSDVTKTIP